MTSDTLFTSTQFKKSFNQIQIRCDYNISIFDNNILYFSSYFGETQFQIPNQIGCGFALQNKQIILQFFFKKNLLTTRAKSNFIKKAQRTFVCLFVQYVFTKIRLLFIGMRIDLVLQGIGFRVYLNKTKRIVAYKLGYSHKIYYKLPTEVWLRNLTRYSFVLISGNLIKIKRALTTILNFRCPDSYKGKGVKLKTIKLKLKQGKKQI